jgi:hypothetical protein
MKKKNQISLTKKATPDGEGFIALPIAFNSVIARRSGATTTPARLSGAGAQSFASYEIASSQPTLLAMTKIRGK